MQGKALIIALISLFVLALGLGLVQAHNTADLQPLAASPVGTAFTYQGQLVFNDAPVNSTCDFTFSLWDEAGSTPGDGTQIGSDVIRSNTAINNGLFTVQLDFGTDAFSGDARWLEIYIDCNSIGAHATLWPRQPLTPSPYSINSESAADADTVDGEHASAFWSLSGNAGSTPGTHYLGTSDDQALELHVNGSRALRLEPDATSPNLIAGHPDNAVMDNAYGSTIGGGGNDTDENANTVYDHYGVIGGGSNNVVGSNDSDPDTAGGATIAGGQSNLATAVRATVGGGLLNYATADYTTVNGGRGNEATAEAATVGGGKFNDATVTGATVGGGQSNTGSGAYVTVGGGFGNTAGGEHATVPGGKDNDAGGNLSFTSGNRAKANSQGCFVWGDSTAADVTCTDADRTIFRSRGGFQIYTSADLSTGISIAAGSSGWGAPSDRAKKENFEPVHTQALLEKLADIEISTWNYKAQDPAIRHVGPMAQDFNVLLPELGGEGNLYINSLDADGVALAAIQGLYQLAQKQSGRIETLAAENATLQQRLDDLEALVMASKHAPGANTDTGAGQ